VLVHRVGFCGIWHPLEHYRRTLWTVAYRQGTWLSRISVLSFPFDASSTLVLCDVGVRTMALMTVLFSTACCSRPAAMLLQAYTRREGRPLHALCHKTRCKVVAAVAARKRPCHKKETFSPCARIGVESSVLKGRPMSLVWAAVRSITPRSHGWLVCTEVIVLSRI